MAQTRWTLLMSPEKVWACGIKAWPVTCLLPYHGEKCRSMNAQAWAHHSFRAQDVDILPSSMSLADGPMLTFPETLSCGILETTRVLGTSLLR